MFASTLRYHNGTFYLISSWASKELGTPQYALSTTNNPYDNLAWSNVKWLETPGLTIDPDIFFDDDGSVILSSAGDPIIAMYLDLDTGKTSEPWNLWEGTGGSSPEGPHIYKKDGFYYLLIAEGRTQLNHSATIARSTSLKGPWEPSPHNPLVSNRDTDDYFQTVGHADLFQDSRGNWWGVALSTRGGPRLYRDLIQPLGRETVLFPVSWLSGHWPIADRAQGNMTGPLPQSSVISQGVGPTVGLPDVVDFETGSAIPSHWVSWRAPFDANDLTVSPRESRNTLRLTSSRANLTTDSIFNATKEGVTALFRRQEHTYFNFSVNIHLGFGTSNGHEVGVSNFALPDQHVDIGIVYLKNDKMELLPNFRLRARSVNAYPLPPEIIKPISKEWCLGEIEIQISSNNETHCDVYARKGHEEIKVGSYSKALLTSDGATSGGVLGVYATQNGGQRTFYGYVSKWRYSPVAQKIGYKEVIKI
ncbi:glycoside hydrolase family 43 [Fusarium mundagurra]|uniref:Glycoside hydrolase family 43 n=1 Tax=Fusarium mundagurra TaxID=1567541 RepID=A0A8H5XSC2_9HYPO|nr:glycoside hydrolase family 43 [Fusarium mundagurra]